jgi:hypothetical protein
MTALLHEEGEDLVDTTTLTPPHLIEAHGFKERYNFELYTKYIYSSLHRSFHMFIINTI